MSGSFHKLMVYLTGIDANKERELQRLQLAEAAARNMEVHENASTAIRRSNNIIATLLRYLDAERMGGRDAGLS